jgi:prepilin-type N-terminal cleavage/methylation domain-containing protein
MSARSRQRDERGFSALELLVVMAILSFVVGIAIPAFQVVRLGAALSSAQRDVVAAVQNARWRAINTGAVHTVDLTSGSTIAITKSGATVASLPLGQYFVSQTHSGGSTFDFDPRGLIPVGTTTPITITLTNPGSATRTVTIDRLGRITAS